MKLQELINKLSNILASGAGEADVKVDDKNFKTAALVEVDGVKIVNISSLPDSP